MVTLNEITQAIKAEVDAGNIQELASFFDSFNKLNQKVSERQQEINKQKQESLMSAAEVETATNFDPLLNAHDDQLPIKQQWNNIVDNFHMIFDKMKVLNNQIRIIHQQIAVENNTIKRIIEGLEAGDINIHKANIDALVLQYQPLQAQLQPLRLRLEAFEILYDQVRDNYRENKKKT